MQNDERNIVYDMLYCIYDKVRCAWESTLQIQPQFWI